jgi:hypothetical protein
MTSIDIIKIPNFISDEDCAILVDAFENPEMCSISCKCPIIINAAYIY